MNVSIWTPLLDRDHAEQALAAITCRVKDACFCHGSAGLAHLFSRFYHASMVPMFAQSAQYWLSETLRFRQSGVGAAGYSVLLDSPDGSIVSGPSFGILDGIAGIGLVLLETVTNIEPCWDRIFLTDVPPIRVAS